MTISITVTRNRVTVTVSACMYISTIIIYRLCMHGRMINMQLLRIRIKIKFFHLELHYQQKNPKNAILMVHAWVLHKIQNFGMLIIK